MPGPIQGIAAGAAALARLIVLVATLTGLGDQQELLAGLRALVRMVRAEPS